MQPHGKISNRIYLIILIAILMSIGCTSVINPYKENFSCRSKDENGMCIDSLQSYKHAVETEEADNKEIELLGEKEGISTDYQKEMKLKLASLIEEPKAPLISPPKIMRVLILPYQGNDGELFMPRYTYFRVDDGKWLFYPEKPASKR